MESRATVIFRGRVQGVYFRANCAEKAESLGLRGYVRNLPDGRPSPGDSSGDTRTDLRLPDSLGR
ncbi:MAG: acylphosphatase [Methanobacteriota archaeon]|nr:MAG: acylphosphatase [Euryarchaeota archaeon]